MPNFRDEILTSRVQDSNARVSRLTPTPGDTVSQRSSAPMPSGYRDLTGRIPRIKPTRGGGEGETLLSR